MRLPEEFFLREDVVTIARQLLGKVLVTHIGGAVTSGVITETEAYAGVTDRASHAFGGRRTPRTETMYLPGGHSYVYLCYGIHSLFNVVTGPRDLPHAVLIRAIDPLEGIGSILKRRNANGLSPGLCVGPGKVCLALGLNHREHDGLSLMGQSIWLEDRSIEVPAHRILIGPRVGVDYADEDAKLPYRFRFLSERP